MLTVAQWKEMRRQLIWVALLVLAVLLVATTFATGTVL